MVDRAMTKPNAMISNSVLTGGTYNMQTTINQGTPRDPLRILQDASSPSAFHNSGERYDPPKCHENTRVAVLKKIMDWVIGCNPETRDKRIMWLYGGAGAGKSAIAQTMAERCDAEGRLLASFFFGRSDVTRNHAKFLFPTLTSQIFANIPGARNYIASIINNDPLIFNKSLLIQLMSLVVEPLRHLGDTVSQHLIIIDGLDECIDRASQVTILRSLFDAVQKHNCRIRFLVASRPEHDIVNAFSSENIEMILARLVLDDEYQSHEDIELFLHDKFKDIAETHPFRNLVPKEWPGDHVVHEIAKKAFGQFIYASIVVKYIESIRHRPDQRLEIVRNLRARNGDSDLPFAELDALYTHILNSIENASLVVEILSFIIHETHTKHFGYSYKHILGTILTIEEIEEIHDLEAGSLQILLCDIGSLVSFNDYFGETRIKVLHVSVLDFLIDPSRSKDLHIPASLLITKHVTNCLRVLSKNDVNTLNTSTEVAVDFLIIYCNCVTFTTDIASAFEKFSLLNLFQSKTLWLSFNLTFLLRLNPILLNLIRQSDQHEFLSRYTTMLDESYVTLLDTYPQEYLALQLSSTIIHPNVFPYQALEKPFQFPQSFLGYDYMWISEEPDYDNMFLPHHVNATRVLFEEYRVTLREFLLDPVRSRHHSFQSSAGKMYAKSLLACFSYLDTQLFHYDSCPHCKVDRLIPFDNEEPKVHTDAVFHNPPICYATNNEWKEWDQTKREAWDKYYSCSPENVDIVDTDKDIQAWSWNWQKVVSEDKYDDSFKYCSSLDTERLSALRPDPVSLRKTWLARYGLMLGYMIYFAPRAGKSQKLIELCKTTILPRDATLFPQDTVSAHRAMAAYLKRVEALEDEDSEVHLLKRLLSSSKDTKTTLPSGSLMSLD